MSFLKFLSTLTMAQVHAALAHLLPVLDDHIPGLLSNSTAVDDAESAATDNTFLRNVLSENFSVIRVGFFCLETTPNFLTSKARRQ